jgi:hypothetical protein
VLVVRGAGGFRLIGGLPAAERTDEPARLGAGEHDGRGLAVPERAEPDERGLSGGAHVRAVPVGVAAVGETAQAAEPEARSGRQVVQAVAERHRAGGGGAGVGAGERLGVVVVSFHEQKLEACPAEQGTGEAEEAAPFRVTRQVAEVAEAEERLAAFLDGLLDQAAQVASVGVQVAEDEQPAHSSRAYRARSPLTGARGSRYRLSPVLPQTFSRPREGK